MVDPARRSFLGALAGLPFLGVVRAEAREYRGPSEVFEAVDTLARAADARLAALGRALPSAGAFVDSARGDLARHRRERESLDPAVRTADAPVPEVPSPLSLPLLRSALEDLAHAHAEGLPALGSPERVQRLAEHMVDLARLVAVVDLWIEMEEGRE